MEKQTTKMKEGEKQKKTAEEIITHNMIRQEEMEMENETLLKQVQVEDARENKILEKRGESKYTLQFIESF